MSGNSGFGPSPIPERFNSTSAPNITAPMSLSRSSSTEHDQLLSDLGAAAGFLDSRDAMLAEAVRAGLVELVGCCRERDEAVAQSERFALNLVASERAQEATMSNYRRVQAERDAAVQRADRVEQLRAKWAGWSGGRYDEYAAWAERQLAAALAGTGGPDEH